MPAGFPAGAGSTQGLPVDRDPATASCGRTCPFLGPPAEHVVEGVGVQGLQGPPERGLTRHHLPGADLGQGRLVGVRGPFGDRDERARASEHRAHRQPHHRRKSVTHPAPLTRIGDPGQDRQHIRPVIRERLGQGEKVADLRGDR